MKNPLIYLMRSVFNFFPKKKLTSRIKIENAVRLIQNAGYPDFIATTKNQEDLIQQVINALCDLSLYDGLTGLVTPRYFRSTLDREVERAIRTGQPLSLLLLDIDHFKKINDNYGHLAGDQILKVIGEKLRASLRTMDTAARYGGEEFAVILPNTSIDSAVKISGRLRRRIQGEVSHKDNQRDISVTTSIGIAILMPDIPCNGEDLLKKADFQLYQAKTLGRNRVCYEACPSIFVSKQEKAALWDIPEDSKEKP